MQVRGTLLSTVTNGEGQFTLSGVPTTPHTIRVIAIGYAADSLPGLTLTAGENADCWRSDDASHAARPAGDHRHREPPLGTARRDAGERGGPALQRDPRRATSPSLNRALEFVPGVTFNGPDQMDIRGSTGFARGVGSRVLMLLDGHPALSADGGEINFRALPVIDLARTEVVKGAYSALYGSNALGGVVNLDHHAGGRPAHHGGAGPLRRLRRAVQLPLERRAAQFAGTGAAACAALGPMGARAFVGYQGTDGYTQNGQNHIWMARVKFQALPTATHQWDAFALYTNEKSQEFLTWRADSLPFEVSPQFLGDYARDQVFLSGATVAAIATAKTLAQVQPVPDLELVAERFHREPGPPRGDQAGHQCGAHALAQRRRTA